MALGGLFKSRSERDFEKAVYALAPLLKTIGNAQGFSDTNAFIKQLLSGFRSAGSYVFNYDLVKFIQDGYVQNPHVYSVINKILQPAKSIPWAVYHVKDEKKLKAYKYHMKHRNYLEADAFRIKALERVEDTPMNEMFDDKVNEYQIWPEFVEASLGYYLLTGNDFTYKGILPGFKYPDKLYAMPAQLVKIYPNTDEANFKRPIKGYGLVIAGTDKPIEAHEIYHRKMFNPNLGTFMDAVNLLYGLSPLAPLCRVVKRTNESLEASLALILNGAPPGILTDASSDIGVPIKKEDRNSLIASWIEKYGGGRKKGLPVISPVPLKWIPIGVGSADLELLDVDKAGLMDVARVYNVPDVLVNPESKTYNNMSEAKKMLYFDAVIPHLTSFRDAFNKNVSNPYSDYAGKKYWCDFDLKTVEVLQEDKKGRSDMILLQMEHGLFTANEALELLDYPNDPNNPLLNQRILLNTLRYVEVDKIPEQYRAAIAVLNSLPALVANNSFASLTEDESRALMSIGQLPEGAETIRAVMKGLMQQQNTPANENA